METLCWFKDKAYTIKPLVVKKLGQDLGDLCKQENKVLALWQPANKHLSLFVVNRSQIQK